MTDLIQNCKVEDQEDEEIQLLTQEGEEIQTTVEKIKLQI